MMDEMNDELRKMIEQENSMMNMTNSIATMYKGFIEAGLPEHIAVDLIKFYSAKAMEQANIKWSKGYDE